MLTQMPSEKAANYGDALRRAMERTGDSQARAGTRLGKSAPTIGTYIRGEVEMPYVVRERASRVYKINPAELDLDESDSDIDHDVIQICIEVLRSPHMSDRAKELAGNVLGRLTQNSNR